MNDGLVIGIDMKRRCEWCGDDYLYAKYHDKEWGVPVADDARLFEKICLEGFQAGLSWITILRKRDNFRAAFDDFDYHKIATYNEDDVERLLDNAGIIRHRGKIEACINNATRAIEMEKEFGSLSAYFWQFEPEESRRPKVMDYTAVRKLDKTPESTKLSRDLKKRGWKFVGPTTCYAFMQAMGMVNDHVEGCHRREDIAKLRAGFKRPVSA